MENLKGRDHMKGVGLKLEDNIKPDKAIGLG
jgi:hypothetical protein